LFVSPSYKYPVRVQAPYVSTSDAENVIQAIKEKYLAASNTVEEIYDQDLLSALEGSKPESTYGSG
jgi:DNA segregation ATPase FtsK/SpoIIIE-like protein